MSDTENKITASALEESTARKASESAAVVTAFFQENAATMGRLAEEMAERFGRGGRLYAIGNGGSACDAEHAAVEFMHPIIETRRPLPAVSLASAGALVSALANDVDFSQVYVRQLKELAGADDMLLALSTSGMSANLVAAVREANRIGLLTTGFLGKDGGRLAGECRFSLVVPSYSIHRIQETHVTMLHVLWDLVHLAMGEEDIV